jgi:UDP-N-acetyl-D-glucosamine dehydrogenase
MGKSVRGSRIFVLGVAYKRDTSDVRESPAIDVIRILQERGARIRYHDPHVPRLRTDGGGALRRTPLSAKNLAASDCVLIVTDHSSYDYDWILRHARKVLDTRNATRGVRHGADRIVRL